MPAALTAAYHATSTTPHTTGATLCRHVPWLSDAPGSTSLHSTAGAASNTCPLTNHANHHTTSRSAPQEGWAHTHAATIKQHTGKPPHSQDQHYNLYCVE